MKIDKTQIQLENQKKMLSNAGIQLIAGEFIEKCKDIPANSISLIYIDPPYDRWWLPLYGPLGELAFTVLEEGGSLVMNAEYHALPQIFDCMKNTGLKYWWEIVIEYNGPYARIVSKNVIATYKRLLWFVKDQKPKISEFIFDSVKSKTPEKPDHWTQCAVEAEHVISKLTGPNDIVDPLMGTGTTAIAAIRLKRRFVGIEKNADTLAIARHRISTAISSDQKSVHNTEGKNGHDNSSDL